MGILKNGHQDLERTGFGAAWGPGRPELVISVLGEPTPRTSVLLESLSWVRICH